MNPLFKITTPNGQTIEGYENPDNRKEFNIKLNSRLNNWLAYNISEVTEAMAKDWGFGWVHTHENKSMSSKQDFHNKLFDKHKKDLSNILLILIEHE